MLDYRGRGEVKIKYVLGKMTSTPRDWALITNPTAKSH